MSYRTDVEDMASHLAAHDAALKRMHWNSKAEPSCPSCRKYESFCTCSTMVLDWGGRQLKDAPWNFDLYPCGCDPYNGEDEGRYECVECHPLRVYLELRDRKAAKLKGRPSALFLEHQEYIDSSRFSLLGPMGMMSRILKTFYVPAIKEQLNQSIILSSDLAHPTTFTVAR
jgi:hypothetical protein